MNHNRHTKSPTFRATVSGLLFMLLQLPGCGYPEVSPKTYEIAKALYSVSNLKREEALEKIEALISESLQTGELSDREADFLTEIVAHCRAGDWETAQSECRKLMEDQIGTQRDASPHRHEQSSKTAVRPQRSKNG